MKRLVFLPLASVMVILACAEPVGPDTEQSLPLQPDHQITCRVTIDSNSMSCDPPAPAAAHGLALNVSLGGGQGTYVRLASSSSVYNGTSAFSTTVTVQNRTSQPMGTANGTTADANGVRVFFVSGPTVTSGTGAVTVANADGSGTFTASNQPYFQYGGMLKPDSVSASKTWMFNAPSSVHTFSFVVMVNTKLPDDLGVLHWTPVTPITSAALGEVSQANGEVWAVGTGATIIHYDGSSWQTQASPVPGVTLRGVEMYPGSPVKGFAVGDNSTILGYTGTAWQTVTTTPSGGGTFTTICRISATEIYIVGAGGFIGHSTNGNLPMPTFTQELPPAGGSTDFFTCGGAGPTDVYVSGLSGIILHSTGNGVWTQQTSGTDKALRAIAWIGNGSGGLREIWLTGASIGIPGIMLHSTGGGTWTPVSVPGDPVLRGMRSSDPNSPNDIFGVGYNGAITHYNGTTWSSQASGTTEQLNHITFRPLPGGGREWWIVGNNGIMLRGTR